MTPTQREAALLLANTETQWRALKWEQDVIALLRELAAEPEPDHFVEPMAEQLLQVIAGIWHEHPDYSLRQTLEALNALMLPAEPVQEPVAYVDHADGAVIWKQARLPGGSLLYAAPQPQATEPSQDTPPQGEPVQKPVAWWCKHPHGGGFMTCDELAAQHYMHKFRRAGENGPTLVPLYAAPQHRKPLTQHEIESFWLLRSDIHDGELMPQLFDFARAVEAAHGIKETP